MFKRGTEPKRNELEGITVEAASGLHAPLARVAASL